MRATFVDAILAWYAESGRHELPWRQTRDPWRVLVSELMLQQTQVVRVVPKYTAFVSRFPSADACAAAPVSEVVRLWAGLGYNRRAVSLHRAAVAIVEAGEFPSTLDGLLALPGIGPYTARAVMAFAFEQPVCPLDVNTARPLARTRGVATQADADALVPPNDSWRWNEALMDLGALVCTRRDPVCGSCPVASMCLSHRTGGEDPSAPASRQSRFVGSDRQGRGRLVDALRAGPVLPGELPHVMGWPDDPERAARVAKTVLDDGLAERLPGGALSLPR